MGDRVGGRKVKGEEGGGRVITKHTKGLWFCPGAKKVKT